MSDRLFRAYPWYVPPDEILSFGGSSGVYVSESKDGKICVEPRVIRDVPQLVPNGEPKIFQGDERASVRAKIEEARDVHNVWQENALSTTRLDYLRWWKTSFSSVQSLKSAAAEAAQKFHRRECAFCDRRGNCLATFTRHDGSVCVFSAWRSSMKNKTNMIRAYDLNGGISFESKSGDEVRQLASVEGADDRPAVVSRGTRACVLWSVSNDREDCSVSSSRSSNRLAGHQGLRDMCLRPLRELRLENKSVVHVAASHVIPYEITALTMADPGATSSMCSASVELWDANASTAGELSTSYSLDLRDVRQCEYAHHPRTLCVSSSEGIHLVDLRGRSSRSSVIRSAADNSDMLGPVRIHPSEPFHALAGGEHHMLLLDTRYGRLPLLRWEHFMSDAPPEAIEIVPNAEAPSAHARDSTFVCASSLSLRGGCGFDGSRQSRLRKSGGAVRSIISPHFRASSDGSSRSSRPRIYGDRRILSFQYIPGERVTVPSSMVGSSSTTIDRTAWGPPRPLGLLRHVRTTAEESSLHMRDPIAGLGAIRDTDGVLNLLWLTRYGVVYAQNMSDVVDDDDSGIGGDIDDERSEASSSFFVASEIESSARRTALLDSARLLKSSARAEMDLTEDSDPSLTELKDCLLTLLRQRGQGCLCTVASLLCETRELLRCPLLSMRSLLVVAQQATEIETCLVRGHEALSTCRCGERWLRHRGTGSIDTISVESVSPCDSDFCMLPYLIGLRLDAPPVDEASPPITADAADTLSEGDVDDDKGMCSRGGIRTIQSSYRKGLIAGSADKTIIHWTISNQEKVRTFRGHTNNVLTVDTYGDLLVSGGFDNILILWSISKGDRLRDLRGHSSWVYCVRFSSFDGKSVFSGSGDKTVIRWKVSDGAQIMKYEGGHWEAVMSLAVTKDDSKLITGSHDHTCIIWNILSGARLYIFRGHNEGVRSVALSPCERYFASGSKDKMTILWDIANGKQVLLLADHNNTVKDVIFSGRRILFTASDDGTAIEYDINSLFKDIPARIEFLLVLQRHHASALSTSSPASTADASLENLIDFAAYVNSRPRLKCRVLSFI
eukprot:g2499.t1